MDAYAYWQQFEGQWVDRSFFLHHLLGHGTFGGVFFTNHYIENTFVRSVALKLIWLDPNGAGQAEIDEKLKELITAANLRHPYLVSCPHAGSAVVGNAGTKCLYLVMELADGSLASRLKKKLLSVAEATELIEQVASALTFLHTRFAHRDVKPDNILRVGEVWKLSDYGLIRPVSPGASGRTGLVAGTISYMPPEAFDNVYSPAFDMWSLGVLVVEALTGKKPFSGTTLLALIYAITTEKPNLVLGDLHPFDQIIHGCLIKDHHTRWTGEQVLSELRLIRRDPVLRPTSPIVREEELTAQQWFELGFAATAIEEQLRFYNEAIRLKPDDAYFFNSRGRARSDKGDVDGALEDYNEAIRLKPDDAYAFNDRGRTRSDKGDVDGALEDYNEAIRLKPDCAYFFYDRGLTRRDKGDVDGALEDYNEAIRLKPDDAYAFNDRGRTRSDKGDVDGALEDYNEAIRLKPDCAYFFYDRGLTRRDKGDVDGALEDYNEAIRLKPDAHAFNNRGLARRDKGDVDGALEDYNEAIRLKPDYAFAFYNRANARRSKGDVDGALEDYNEAIRLKPDYAFAFYNRANARRSKGDVDGALEDYNEAIRLKPDYAFAFNSRGLARRAKGDVDGALEDHNEAIRLKPDYAIAFNSRGLARRAKGDVDGALEDHNEAIRLKSGYAIAFYNRGLARGAKGDVNGALEDHNEAIRLGYRP